MHYRFKEALQEGTILARPNRFLMVVELQGETTAAHCPATGRIGDIIFDHVPCLLSESQNPLRKTKYTVEAISLHPPSPDKKWIGINQNKANRYLEFFLTHGAMPEIVQKGERLIREPSSGRSRIDFATDDTLIEIKTPLITLPTPETNVATKQRSPFTAFDRLIRQFYDLAAAINEGSIKRAIVILCYLYDAPAFVPPAKNRANVKIKEAAERAATAGVETWQANLRLTPEGVHLIRYFRLRSL